MLIRIPTHERIASDTIEFIILVWVSDDNHTKKISQSEREKFCDCYILAELFSGCQTFTVKSSAQVTALALNATLVRTIRKWGHLRRDEHWKLQLKKSLCSKLCQITCLLHQGSKLFTCEAALVGETRDFLDNYSSTTFVHRVIKALRLTWRRSVFVAC
jgi:hypothetical protein